MRILIAEDSPIIQKLNSTLMKGWGFDFDIASNGIEAIEYAKKNNGEYDLCLMDIEMPKMNGIEATRIIRKTTRYFPIMGLTSSPSYKQACQDAGTDDFAEKPCKPDSLFSKISELAVKSITCLLKTNSLISKEEMPVDQKHAEELRELAKRGLCKMRLKVQGPTTLRLLCTNTSPTASHMTLLKKRQKSRHSWIGTAKVPGKFFFTSQAA